MADTPESTPTSGLLVRLDRRHDDLIQRIDELNEQIESALGEVAGAAGRPENAS